MRDRNAQKVCGRSAALRRSERTASTQSALKSGTPKARKRPARSPGYAWATLALHADDPSPTSRSSNVSRGSSVASPAAPRTTRGTVYRWAKQSRTSLQAALSAWSAPSSAPANSPASSGSRPAPICQMSGNYGSPENLAVSPADIISMDSLLALTDLVKFQPEDCEHLRGEAKKFSSPASSSLKAAKCEGNSDKENGGTLALGLSPRNQVQANSSADRFLRVCRVRSRVCRWPDQFIPSRDLRSARFLSAGIPLSNVGKT